MRVISGRFKGRRLLAPDTQVTRPVTDRVKEAVFSSLGERVEGSRVLDLYAGVGSFGIEAVSRGAVSVVFVEQARPALRSLAANLETLAADLEILGVTAAVIARPVEEVVGGLAGTFDLVFCDPPWALPSSDLASVLEQVAVVTSDDGRMVVTRRAGDPVADPVGLRIDHDRRHGDTRIIRYSKGHQ